MSVPTDKRIFLKNGYMILDTLLPKLAFPIVLLGLQAFCDPLAGCHACDGFEIAEEGGLGAESRLYGYVGGLHVWLLP